MSFFDPITRERFARFRRHRAGWWSLIALTTLAVLALLGPLLVGSRPLVLKLDDTYRFPVFAGFIPGRELGLAIEGEPDYRLLAEELKANGRGWALMPPVPLDRKSTRLNSSHVSEHRVPSSVWKKKT